MRGKSFMPRDPKGEETKEWLTIAKKDLLAGRVLATNEDFAPQSVFHAQQSAEKAIKAFLVWHQERFKKDHDLRYLGDLAIKKDPTLSDLIDEAVSLNPYAVTARYPGFDDDIESSDVDSALELAEKIYNEILKRLPMEIHP